MYEWQIKYVRIFQIEQIYLSYIYLSHHVFHQLPKLLNPIILLTDHFIFYYKFFSWQFQNHIYISYLCLLLRIVCIHFHQIVKIRFYFLTVAKQFSEWTRGGGEKPFRYSHMYTHSHKHKYDCLCIGASRNLQQQALYITIRHIHSNIEL